MDNLVYLQKGDKGLYVKDKGRYYFIDKSCLGSLKEGFAYVKIVTEKDKYGFVKGKMVKPSTLNLEKCGRDLYRLGGSYWNVSVVNGVEVAWFYTGDVLSIFINGVCYTNWGYDEFNLYCRLEELDWERVYTYGYWVRDWVNSKETDDTIPDISSIFEWWVDGDDVLYCFGGKIYMFDPTGGSMKNKGVYFDGSYKSLDCLETMDMWEFLCKEYADSKVSVLVSNKK